MRVKRMLPSPFVLAAVFLATAEIYAFLGSTGKDRGHKTRRPR